MNAGPKGVVSKVSAELGGVVGASDGASDGCMLPRNEQQVIKAKSRSKSSVLPCSTSNDEFAAVMQHAFLEDSFEM